jgi:hypothetical protein
LDKSGENPFDIWGPPLELDEFSVAPEPENEDAEDATVPSELTGTRTGSADGNAVKGASAKETPEPDVLDRLGDELDALESGTEPTVSSKAYKGIQRALARRDAEMAALRQQYEQSLARQAKYEEDLASINAATNLNWKVLNSNLEDESRKEAELALLRQREQFRNEQQARAQQRPQATAQPEPEAWEINLAAAVEREAGLFESGLQELAQLAGVDPKSPALDYGQANETFNERVKRFNTSLRTAQKATEEAEVQAVRGKTVATRGANGGETPVSNSGLSDLQLGASQRSAQFRQLIGTG